MKSFPTLFLITLLYASPAFGQDATTEQEARRFFAEYEKGVARRDIAFLERVLPDDYVYTGPSGKMTDRVNALKHFKKQRDNPDAERVSLEHLNVHLRVIGNVAIVTNDWIAKTRPIDSATAEPTTDKGRYTGVFEKRNGQWIVIAEHDSEQLYDDDWMVSGATKAGRRYNELRTRLSSGRPYHEMERSGEVSDLNRLLADEYTYTSDDGEIRSKTEAMEWYSLNRAQLQSAEYLEQNVRTIGNGMAVETAKLRHIGTDSDGPFYRTMRHTITWAFYDGRWQVAAEHTSSIKNEALE